MRGMSDLDTYEGSSPIQVERAMVEDIGKLDDVWEGFDISEDHIVPCSGNANRDQFGIQHDWCKKPQQESYGMSGVSDIAAKYGTLGKEKTCLPTLSKRKTMLEETSWSDTSNGVYPISNGDLCKEARRLTSDDRMPSHCLDHSTVEAGHSQLFADDAILDDKHAILDDNVSQYSLDHMSRADSELNLNENGDNHKGRGDLLDYGWLNIESFEDVDRMFSCDSKFGVISLNNEEELCWPLSSHGTEGPDDALKCDFRFSYADRNSFESVSDYSEEPKVNSFTPSVNISNEKRILIIKNVSSQSVEVDDAGGDVPLSVLTESMSKSGSPDDSETKEKITLSNHQNPSERSRRNDCLGNGDSVHSYPNLKQNMDVEHSYRISSGRKFSHLGKHLKQNVEHDSLDYMQTNVTSVHSNSHDSDNIPSHSTLSGVQSENNGYECASLKEPSYSSNMGSSCVCHLEIPAGIANEKTEKIFFQHNAQAYRTSFKKESLTCSMTSCIPVSIEKQERQSENGTEGHSEVEEISNDFLRELESSNVQESSSISFALDKVSHEATSFLQLQQVMDQLDVRTRLCIRDSLYRLAKSAERRHNYTSAINSTGGAVEVCRPMMAQDNDSGFMDMETNTNPIDRSIAHLMFCTPSDPFTLPVEDCPLLNSSAVVNRSTTSSLLKIDKKVLQVDSTEAEN